MSSNEKTKGVSQKPLIIVGAFAVVVVAVVLVAGSRVRSQEPPFMAEVGERVWREEKKTELV